MNNSFTIATILVNKNIGMKNYMDFKDAFINNLARKVKIKIGKNATSRWPDEQLSMIKLISKDGSIRGRSHHLKKLCLDP